MQINGVGSNECPVSLTSGWIFQLLIDYSESARFEHQPVYQSLADWPADVFDAFAIFHYEENRIQSARMETDRSRIQLR